MWDRQAGYAATLGAVPRIALASVIAYFCGNSSPYIVAKMKIAMQGRRMGLRRLLHGRTKHRYGRFMLIASLVCLTPGICPSSV